MGVRLLIRFFRVYLWLYGALLRFVYGALWPYLLLSFINADYAMFLTIAEIYQVSWRGYWRTKEVDKAKESTDELKPVTISV